MSCRRGHRTISKRGSVFAGLVMVLHAGFACAQGTGGGKAADSPLEHRWELEVHGGLSTSNDPGGTASLPSTAQIVGGLVSASSFFFGSGGRLFNENLTAVAGPGAPTISLADGVVSSPAIGWQDGSGAAGIRLSRAINPRLAVEFAVDYEWSTLRFTEAAKNALQAAGNSYGPALMAALSTGASPSAAATLSLSDHQRASRVSATGAVLVNLRTTGGVIPYFLGGGGFLFRNGDAPGAVLTGSYAFGSPSRVLASDSVFLSYGVPDHAYPVIAGGGLKYYRGGRWGLRVDSRVHVWQNDLQSATSVTPGRALSSAGTSFPLVSMGSLQFSSTAPLTGPAIGAITFSGSGYQTTVSFTAGLFWRF